MCVWAITSANLCAALLPPLCVEEEEVVDVVDPWIAWLIQCSIFILPWLEVGVPWESPCTEPSSSDPEEVSIQDTVNVNTHWSNNLNTGNKRLKKETTVM